jgi:hypothetical protein
MNPYVLAVLALAALLIWSLGSYFYWRINKKSPFRESLRESQPALLLADQWLAQAQQKMEDLDRRSEQPLSTAQNELLELRLEAGRLSLGIKDLKMVREALAGPWRPGKPAPGLLETARLYLPQGDYRTGEEGLVYLRTPLGEMPCLEAGGPGGPLGEEGMKRALALLSRALGPDSTAGGLLFFREESQYRQCLAHPPWSEGLKSHRLAAGDFRGLIGILSSLRLIRDAQGVLEVFGEAVERTKPLTGQSDRMGAGLTRLGGHSLKVRTALEGGAPLDMSEPKEPA